MGFMIGRRAFAIVLVCGFAITACSSGSGGSPSAASSAAASAPASGTATTVDVKLQEWAVVPAVTSAPAGSVVFSVTNIGPEDVHEFVVLKTDLEPGALPVDANGSVTETGAGIAVIDEIEDIALQAKEELTVTLEAGKYVLMCNIYDETEKQSHYKMGMRIGFTVE